MTAKESWEPPAALHLAFPGPITHHVPTGAAEPFRIGKTNHHEINANAEGAMAFRQVAHQRALSSGDSWGWLRITARSRSDSGWAYPRPREPNATRG